MKADSELRLDVLAELEWEPAVDATGVEVHVDDGIVTITGHVRGLTEKLDVENAIQRVCGVKALTVELNVKLSESIERLKVFATLSMRSKSSSKQAFS